MTKMLRRRNIPLISQLIAAAAAMSIPRLDTRSFPLDYRGTAARPWRADTLAPPVRLGSRNEPRLKIHVENRLDRDVSAYVSGQVDGKYALLRAAGDGGSSSFVYAPTEPAGADGVEIPGFEDLVINIPSGGRDLELPGYVASGRLYVSETPDLRFRANVGADGAAGLVQPDFMNPGDPGHNASWGFMEFTHSPASLFVNLSFVDFVGLALGMSMTYETAGDGNNSDDGNSNSNSNSNNNNNNNQTTETVGGLDKDALARICDELAAVPGQPAGAPSPWADLCQRDPATGAPVRVVSPEKYMSAHPGGPLDTYYDAYVDEVWARFSREPLVVDTQDDQRGHATADGPDVDCRVEAREGGGDGGDGGGSDPLLVCRDPRDNSTVASIGKPTSRDIFGCAAAAAAAEGGAAGGAFAHDAGADAMIKLELIPRLCAAFSRSTLLLGDGSDGEGGAAAGRPMRVAKASYYQHAITNHYARVVHDHLEGGRGYAFAYDDVNMDPTDPGENTAGVIEQASPVRLTVIVGGYDAPART